MRHRSSSSMEKGLIGLIQMYILVGKDCLEFHPFSKTFSTHHYVDGCSGRHFIIYIP